MPLQDTYSVAPGGAPPVQRRLGAALLVIAAAQLMLVLDNTIMNVALPSIQGALGLATSDLNWVITAYALGFGGLLLAGGRAGDLFGRRRVFRAGLVLFTVASLLGGLAPTGAVLIGARGLQGIGAALAAPTALSLLATTFPAGPARNRAIGVYGAMGGLGAVGGLLLGGALTDYLNWRWVLFVNVPIAVLVLAGSRVLVEGDRDRGRIDLPGAVSATAGFTALVFAINRAGTAGWSDSLTIAILVAAGLLLATFAVIQRRATAPMLPPRVLRDSSRRGAYLVMLLTGSAMFATFYFLTLYMQVVLGYSPMRAGLAYLPFAVGIGLVAGGVGPVLLTRLSERTVIVAGLLIAAAGTAWFGLLTPDANPFAVLLPAQLVAGIGIGLTLITITVVGVRGVAATDSGIASSLINASMQIGGALGLAVLVAVASASTRSRLASAAPPDALTHGYATGLLVAAGLFLAAVVLAALTIEKSLPEPDLDQAGRA